MLLSLFQVEAHWDCGGSGRVRTSWEGVLATGSWVFLQPPSPSPPPHRRKGRGRSNRSDVPAGGRRKGEEETRPRTYGGCLEPFVLQILVSDTCLSFQATLEQDRAT